MVFFRKLKKYTKKGKIKERELQKRKTMKYMVLVADEIKTLNDIWQRDELELKQILKERALDLEKQRLRCVRMQQVKLEERHRQLSFINQDQELKMREITQLMQSLRCRSPARSGIHDSPSGMLNTLSGIPNISSGIPNNSSGIPIVVLQVYL